MIESFVLCHPREGGDPDSDRLVERKDNVCGTWIPAFAGMTENIISLSELRRVAVFTAFSWFDMAELTWLTGQVPIGTGSKFFH